MSKPSIEPAKNCKACAHSYMEPDSDLICGHPGAGAFGLFTKNKATFKHCTDFNKFEQHPNRTPDGDLK